MSQKITKNRKNPSSMNCNSPSRKGDDRGCFETDPGLEVNGGNLCQRRQQQQQAHTGHYDEPDQNDRYSA